MTGSTKTEAAKSETDAAKASPIKSGVVKSSPIKVGPIKKRLLALQDRLSLAYGTDISTPKARRAAWWHFHLMDHAFLRVFWSNLDLVAPGVWRANQPSQAQLKLYFQRLGLKSVVNLRGAPDQGFYLFEAEACRELGLTLHDIALSARRAPPRDVLLQVLRTKVVLPFHRPETRCCSSLTSSLTHHIPIWAQVLERANNSEYGLAAGVCTSSPPRDSSPPCASSDLGHWPLTWLLSACAVTSV